MYVFVYVCIYEYKILEASLGRNCLTVIGYWVSQEKTTQRSGLSEGLASLGTMEDMVQRPSNTSDHYSIVLGGGLNCPPVCRGPVVFNSAWSFVVFLHLVCSFSHPGQERSQGLSPVLSLRPSHAPNTILFGILLINRTQIRLYFSSTDWFGTANGHCLFAVPNVCCFWFHFDLTRFLVVYNR